MHACCLRFDESFGVCIDVLVFFCRGVGVLCRLVWV